MKDLILLGAGGLGREVLWMIERMNSVDHRWNILGFVDDEPNCRNIPEKYKIIGNVDWLMNYNNQVNVVCCVASSITRKSIIEKNY